MLNKVMLIGRLGSDPEVRELDNGATLAKISLATNESYKDAQDLWQTKTEWHDLLFWRQLAENAQKNLHKGALLYIEGKLRTRQWEDENKTQRQKTEIEVNAYKLLKRANDQSELAHSVND